MLRFINIGLLFAFSICYLEWGHGNSSFIFEVVGTLFQKKTGIISTLTHPLIIFGLIGLLCLLISTLKKIPHKKITLIGIILLGIIVFFVLLSGILSLNVKIIASTLPFIILSILFFKNYKKFDVRT